MSNKQGITLIELMIVVVIMGILAVIVIPNFIFMQDRAKEITVKAIGYDVQLAVEDYSVVNDGQYPASVADFQEFLPLGNLLENPFIKGAREPIDAAVKSESVYYRSGSVIYRPYTSGRGYRIECHGKGGKQIMTLSSSY